MSPVLVEARIPSEKHFLFRIIIFGFIGTGSAEILNIISRKGSCNGLRVSTKKGARGVPSAEE